MQSKWTVKGLFCVIALAAAAPAQTVLYVDHQADLEPHDGSDWGHACLELYDALALAGPDTVIRVADGTYMPDPESTYPGGARFTLVNKTAIEGGYAGWGAPNPDERNIHLYETILSGDSGTPGDPSDNSEAVVHAHQVQFTTALDGLSVVSGLQCGLFIQESWLALIDCTFRENAGRGVCASESDLTFVRCTFSTNGGGGLEASGGSATLTECSISQNTADTGAGARVDNCQLTLTSCTFSENTAEETGGGLYVEGDAIATLTNCTFSGNTADGAGGMYGSTYPPDGLTLANCSFSGNSASEGGGGATIAVGMLTGCTFDENAAERGGGLWIWAGAITDCIFTANSATEGAGFFTEANPTLTHCAFAGNTATADGGGVYSNTYLWPAGDSPSLIDCKFTGNVATGDGGGMFSDRGLPTLTDCSFATNSATDGGGLCVVRGRAILTRCAFVTNSSTTTGGGMCDAYRGGSTVSDCLFLENTAADGGAYHGTRALFTKCLVIANSATNGGGFCASDTRMIECSFLANSAELGGAVNALWSHATCTNCTFSGNTAQLGGCLYTVSDYGQSRLANCTLVGNRADEGGGLYGGQPMLVNCTLFGNLATTTGGAIVAGDATGYEPTLANCILWNNVAPCDAQIHGGAKVTYSCVQGGWGGEGNTPANPLLGADLHLRPGSPCIDAADNTAVPPDEDDLDGDEDVDEPLPFDLHGLSRFVDDPDTPDSGVGEPPIVDMGAYEFQASAVGSADLDGDGDVDMDDFTLFQQQFTGPLR